MAISNKNSVVQVIVRSNSRGNGGGGDSGGGWRYEVVKLHGLKKAESRHQTDWTHFLEAYLEATTKGPKQNRVADGGRAGGQYVCGSVTWYLCPSMGGRGGGQDRGKEAGKKKGRRGKSVCDVFNIW